MSVSSLLFSVSQETSHRVNFLTGLLDVVVTPASYSAPFPAWLRNHPTMAESPFARPQGHDGGPAFLDGLAKLYISVAIAWTIVLSCGITYLFIHRRETCVRVRNLPLALSAVACLHVYWVLCMVAYPMNGVYPCQVEYW